MNERITTPDMQGDPRVEPADFFNEYLKSDEFWHNMLDLHPSQREAALGYIFTYRNSLGENADFNSYWRHIIRNSEKDLDGFATLIAEKIAEIYGIDSSDPASQPVIFEKFISHYIDHGFYYHSFNGNFRQAIEEKGISAESRVWDLNDIKRLQEIGDRIGFGMLTGWHNINSVGKTFYATNTRNIYRYAVASPEWFAQFTAEGRDVDEEGRNAFYRRDYERAKQNILEFCRQQSTKDERLIAERREYPNLTPEEQNYIIAFFEKYWALICGEESTPCVALINREVFDDSDYWRGIDFDEICRLISQDSAECKAADVVAQVLYGEDMGNDLRTSQEIPRENFSIVELPTYDKLMSQHITDMLQ